ncbi:MAG: hypothetical protein HYV97_11390 [Bdellovibrio sp.]|nr:hypothetical protein [Bdellovibrio sp.]
MKRIDFLALSILIAQSFAPPVEAHANRNRPVYQVPGISGAVEQNRAGYGWLNTSSESEAEALFLEECPRPNQTPAAPCVRRDSELGAALSLASGNLETAFEEILKRRIYEYSALQLSALGKNVPALPDCLANDPKMAAERAQINNLKTTDNADLSGQISELVGEIAKLKKKRNLSAGERAELARKQEQLELRVKLRAVRQSHNNKRMSEALLLERQLKDREAEYCGDDPQSGYCLSIRSNRDRVRLAFPSVFAGGVAEELALSEDQRARWDMRKGLATDMHRTDACGKVPLQQFERELSRMVGLMGAPNPLPAHRGPAGAPSRPNTHACPLTDDQQELQIRRGNNVLATINSDDSGYPELVTPNDDNEDGRPDGIFNQAWGNALLDREDENYDPRMAEAYGKMEKAAEKMKDVFAYEVTRGMAGLCGPHLRGVKGLAEKYPQALRQTVLDMNKGGAQDALKMLLCQKGLMGRFQAYSQSHSCNGVSGDINSAEGVHVERQSVGFPYVSDVNYDVTKSADGTLKIKSKINYVFKYDSSIDPTSGDYAGNNKIPAALRANKAQQESKFNTKVTNWLRDANKFYDDAAKKELPQPKIKFELVQCSDCENDYKPTVNVATCYRAEEPESFSTDFPDETFDAHSCRHVNPYGNWEDAGNYTLGTSNPTIMHETGHVLGLADEYDADYYPAHALGEDGSVSCNSTMASNDGVDCHKIYPRHLLEMIRPTRICPKEIEFD